jgi:hypothetical protein
MVVPFHLPHASKQIASTSQLGSLVLQRNTLRAPHLRCAKDLEAQALVSRETASALQGNSDALGVLRLEFANVDRRTVMPFSLLQASR